MEIYITRTGDSLNSIAKAHGLSARELAELNQLSDPSRIVKGLSLLLPTGADSKPESTQLCAAISPSAERALQDSLLPTLTWLCVQSAGFTSDGQIFMPKADRLLAMAKSHGVIPLLLLSNLGSFGFSPQLGHSLLCDAYAATALIQNLLWALNAHGYGGVALNFQYLPNFDQEHYINFARSLTGALHQAGLYSFCYLSPHQLHPDFGAFADQVILLCHGYGGIDTPPQAIAPLPMVEAAVAKALAMIPKEKLRLSLSAYGCAWLLPWRQGLLGEYISCPLSVDTAVSCGSEIKWDNAAAAPFFTVKSENLRRIVYYEDCRSINARLDLIRRYKLAGVELYTQDRLYRPAVELLKNRFYGEKLV